MELGIRFIQFTLSRCQACHRMWRYFNGNESTSYAVRPARSVGNSVGGHRRTTRRKSMFGYATNTRESEATDASGCELW